MVAGLIIFNATLSVATSDHLCNSYCPTNTSNVGSGTYVSPSSVCDLQTCTNARVGSFVSCAIDRFFEGKRCSLRIIPLKHIMVFILSSTSKYRKSFVYAVNQFNYQMYQKLGEKFDLEEIHISMVISIDISVLYSRKLISNTYDYLWFCNKHCHLKHLSV